MSTPILPVPALVLPDPFPTTADRVAGVYNAKSKAWADSEPAMATRQHEIAVVTHNNATAAKAYAQSAQTAAGVAAQSAEEALVSVESARVAAIQAVDTAGAAAIADAEAARDAAALSKDQAAASAAAAQGTLNYKGEWSTLAGPLAPPATVSHDLQLWSLVAPTVAVEADQPGISTKWIIVRERAPIGTVYTGAQPPREGSWLEMDTLYLKAAYPELAAKLGTICSGQGIDPVNVAWPFPSATNRNIKVFDGSAGVLAVADGTETLLIARSQNEGASWSAGAAGYNGVTAMAVAYGNGIDLMLASSGGSAFIRSSDGGLTWQTSNLPGGGVYGVNQLLFAKGRFYTWHTGQCYSSETANGPATWQSTALTLDGSALAAIPSGIVYSPEYGKFLAYTAISGIYKLVSSVDGATWQTVYISPAPISQLCVAQRTVLLVASTSDPSGATVLLLTSSDLLLWRTRLFAPSSIGGRAVGQPFAVANQVCFIGGGSAGYSHPAVLVDSDLNVLAKPSKAGIASGGYLYLAAGKAWLMASGSPYVLQKAPLWDYDRATQFRTPALNGVLGAHQWIKAK